METCSTKMSLRNSTKYNGVDLFCSFDVYVLNFFCEVTLIYLKKMSCFLSVFPFPFSLVICKGCMKGREDIPVFLKCCLSKTHSSGVESSFLSLLLLLGANSRNQISKMFNPRFNLHQPVLAKVLIRYTIINFGSFFL